MDILTSAETAVSLVVERFLAPRRHLQPCELAAMIRKSMLRSRHRLPFSTFVPNKFVVMLPPNDYRRMRNLLPEICEDLKTYLDEYVKKMNFRTVDSISLALESQASDSRMPEIEASFSIGQEGENHGSRPLE